MDKNMNQKPANDKNLSSDFGATKSSDKSSTTHKIGDAIEHAGDRLQEKGAKKIGEKIHDLGDSIEHMNDK